MTTSVVTIFIPFADYHASLVHRAIASAEQQTVACDVRYAPSPGSPARFRNQAMAAHTPFIVFLDADDLLAPRFVEDCLRVYEQGRYVYTSWYEGDYVRKPHECAWSANSHHIVTTLYPTALFKALGGFDETLPGHEDADFYMRCYANRVCGIYLDQPLVSRPDASGQRSNQFHERADYQTILEQVVNRNGGMATIMGCCGQAGTPAPGNPGAMQPGDVLAETTWAGMRSENGHVSGRMYIGGNGNLIYVDPRDIERTPHLFRPVKDLRKLAPEREKILKESGLV